MRLGRCRRRLGERDDEAVAARHDRDPVLTRALCPTHPGHVLDHVGGSCEVESIFWKNATPCHAPDFQPASRNVPTGSKPRRAWSATETSLGIVMPATTERKPVATQASSSAA